MAKIKIIESPKFMKPFRVFTETSKPNANDQYNHVKIWSNGSFSQPNPMNFPMVEEKGIKYAVFWNMEKRNRKTKIVEVNGKKQRKVIRKAHWKVWEYRIPVQNILFAQQKFRNFSVELQM